MPLFEFSCDQCHTPFEALVPNAEAAGDVACPRCGSPKVKKQVSTFASRVGRATRTVSAASSPCASGGCCLNGACEL